MKCDCGYTACEDCYPIPGKVTVWIVQDGSRFIKAVARSKAVGWTYARNPLYTVTEYTIVSTPQKE